MVGDDAADKVGVGVVEGDHELVQLLLVQLGDGPEHALPGDAPELGVRHGLLGHTHDLGWGEGVRPGHRGGHHIKNLL